MASQSKPPAPPPPTLRVARPTKSIPALLPFYTTGLGLTVLVQFAEHENFSGVILGHPSYPYHLEFTEYHGEHVESQGEGTRAPSQDHLLTFYIPDEAEWKQRVGRMKEAGFEPVKSFNPYWDRSGVTFEDVEGWRVVLWRGAWGV